MDDSFYSLVLQFVLVRVRAAYFTSLILRASFAWFGGLRQTLIRIINLRKYVGHIYYIPAPGYEGTGTTYTGELEGTPLLKSHEGDDDKSSSGNSYPGPGLTNSDQWRGMEGPFINIWLNNVPFVGETVNSAPHAKVPHC